MSLKDKLASSLGSVLEWYDFALYGFFAPLIAQLYFPNNSNGIALLKTFAVFSVGFIARPIGAVIFCSLSDSRGRIKSLKITPILITVPTFIFALLPTYQTIGIYAPIILALLRIIQGICIGGEYANNIAYLCETTHSKRTYLMGSLGSCSASFGILLASIIAMLCHIICSPETLIAIGWRMAFGLSLILGIVIYFLRKNISETMTFSQLITKNLNSKRPFTESINIYWKTYLIGFGITFLPATSFYYIFTYLPNYLTTTLKLNPTIILGDSALSLSSRALIIPIIGVLADKIGGINIARLCAILFILLSLPVIYWSTYAPACLAILALLTSLNAGTTPGLLIKLLPLRTRCTMLSLIFNIAFGVFGGIVPVISMALLNSTGNNLSSAIYLMFAAMITLFSTYYFKDMSSDGK